MFTLPIDRVLPVQPTMPGKTLVPRTYSLTTVIQAGAMVNHTDWITGDKIDSSTSNQFNLDILINDVVSTSIQVTNQSQKIITVLTDTDQPTEQTIKFRLTGKNQQETIGPNMHLAVDLQLWIEDLSLNNVIEHFCYYSSFDNGETRHGNGIWSENGELVLKMTTPVYTWLLSNQDLF